MQHRRPLLRHLPVAYAKALVALTLCAAVTHAAELPVRTVVLYKHGVGFFERSGSLAPGETANLQFKTEDMNDVLKSITVTDAGGSVTGLRYDSSIPLEEQLNEFPFRISNGQPLSAVIDQLKGARIEMEFGPQKIAGEIVSSRVIPGDKDRGEREQLTLLMDTGELRNVDLAAATAIRFTDAKLQLQFRDYLTALTGARSKDKRSVFIDSTDAKAREVRATYIMPMPAWKSSYRLLLDSNAQQPTLEGWAIVDNTTGEDWANVRISLVSGKPISFISQLYEPRFITRKEAKLPEDEPLAPTVHSGAVREEQSGAAGGAFRAQKTAGGVLGSAVAGLPGLAPGAPNAMRASRPLAAESSTLGEGAEAAEVADLFEYSIRNPVTVKKNESAMLPFLQQKIGARKLLIYSDPSKSNPLSAAELTNNTGKTLDGGPITVYDAGTYAGEALVETVKTGDKRFISYGVDLGTRISTAFDSRTDNVRELHARSGTVTTTSALVDKRTYSIRNVDAKPKTLIIEHRVRPQFKLVNTQAPVETAKDVYRFEVKVPASGHIDFPVTEENVYLSTTAISSLTPDVLLVYAQNKKLSDGARRQLQAILDQKQKITASDAEKRRLENELGDLTRDEDRLRQNIASLSAVSGQQQIVQDYARKLAEEEGSISRNRDRQQQLGKERELLQAQLNGLIEKLDF